MRRNERVLHRPITDTTEIRWNYELETYECVKCHSIMHYNFDFALCPYCGRRIVRSDDRRYAL